MSQGIDKYAVKYRGKVKWHINEELAKKQNLSDEHIRLIGLMYIKQEKIRCSMSHATKHMEILKDKAKRNAHANFRYFDDRQATAWINHYIKRLRKSFTEWRNNEFMLQALWGFPLNPNYHKDYLLPGCTCPKLDNEDNFPDGFRIINNDCILHS